MMLDFEAKRNALFASLDDASNELKGTTLDQTNTAINPLKRTSAGDVMVYRSVNRTKTNSTERALKNLRGKESMFKKPELPIARCLKPRKRPDYQVNPHKWKKYSLEDVDISDHTNTSAAFEFLREIESQKDISQPARDIDLNQKIEFKKSSKIRRNLKSLEEQEQQDAEIDSPKLKGTKLVMPEYVVGSKKPKNLNAKVKNNRERAAGNLTLSHLQEEEEEEED
ncbi:uncharacterized protein LOC106091838 [Stomoxys calcitrans]|uniref:U5 small nuclear ribonucleoprotein TSSC4 n=1 Tax=Stomoxys calcitrans TaxID=35570 RepID=A0A1I8PML6_STOCA|nr:uncharacterized protein LOC106091838 [Stomoxys calcitrans]